MSRGGDWTVEGKGMLTTLVGLGFNRWKPRAITGERNVYVMYLMAWRVEER
jgi:hypothetical protein